MHEANANDEVRSQSAFCQPSVGNVTAEHFLLAAKVRKGRKKVLTVSFVSLWRRRLVHCQSILLSAGNLTTLRVLQGTISRRVADVVDPWHAKPAWVPRDNQLVADNEDRIGAIASGEADGMTYIGVVGK